MAHRVGDGPEIVSVPMSGNVTVRAQQEKKRVAHVARQTLQTGMLCSCEAARKTLMAIIMISANMTAPPRASL